MSETQQHEMRLETTHPSGAEEWYCPTCGRRFVMKWPPKYRRIILDEGDESALHRGGKGGLKLGAVQIRPSEETATPTGEDLPLDRWESWLDSEDVSKWWPDD